jgi:2-phospho-L-lactate guanylyltransferase (CobY/MobA/RfbA family)
VLVVPTDLEFHFRYGEDSAGKHRDEAERLGVLCRMVTDSPWRFDVDEPSDVTRP